MYRFDFIVDVQVGVGWTGSLSAQRLGSAFQARGIDFPTDRATDRDLALLFPAEDAAGVVG